MKKSSYFVKGLVALSLVSTLAMADEGIEKSSIRISQDATEMQEKNSAKIGVDDVTKVVKNRFDGTIVDVKLENEDGNLVYRAEVLKNNQVTNVIVDAGNGNILASLIDKVDENNDEEEEDNDDENKSSHPWYKFWE